MVHYLVCPAYGHRDLMEKAIASVCRTVKRSDIKFLIKYNDPEIEHKPEGFTKALNDLLKIAYDDKYMESVTVIATDVEIVTSDWLTKILEYVKDKPDVGMVAPFEYLLSDDCALLPYSGVRKTLGASNNKPEELVYPIFAMVWISKDCLRTVGLLDEAFSPGSYDDFDYAVRAKLEGFKTMWFPDVIYKHIRGATIGPLVQAGIYEYPSKQAEYFYKKWKDYLFEGMPAKQALETLEVLRDKNYEVKSR